MTTTEQEYDFIVVGAGSAGCVVAGRLSEAGHSVLLLEAGGKAMNPWIHIPLGYARLYANASLNWCYQSEPEPHLHGRSLFQPRGKVLGGSGSINGMIFIRGQQEDFNQWAALGCEGWDFDGVLPFFKKLENQQRGADPYHATEGPLTVSDLPSTYELGDAFHAASYNLGSPYNYDFNGESQLGTGYVQVNTKNGRRWSTADAYLRKPMAKNISVVTRVMVDKISVTEGKVVGVHYSDKQGQHIARARKETIISAGTFNSPKLLELSGIGDTPVLERNGVPLVHHLPGVGNNLRDHFGIGLEFKCNKPITVNDLYNNPLRGALAMLRYLLFRTGPMASNGNYSNTFIKTSEAIDRPDMMITFMSWCTGEDLSPRPFSGFTILSEHIRPDARGSVHIRSRDPKEQPAIQFNFLATEADQQAAIAGLRHARKISQTEPMRDYISEEIVPGLDHQTDAQLLEHCRSKGLSLLHCVGTCKMGIDDLAVVDPRLRVRGLEGLRVIDASIMPTIVSANTNAASIMIGEKGAQMLIDDWQTIERPKRSVV
ncbi:GMC family oxidoreductase [Reinekea sp.]|jgi:choline dehydrogenase|uniref:GMC family oxidoreductase n=1 Tax=Reinekea sp. TaxID=1970455 RepID=UPI002A8015D7|nr:GMC family oxidoreductase N-terminal domain-containing protein [Reinekea sp.]